MWTLGTAVVIGLATIGISAAQEVTFHHSGPVTLIELYTSEGCSSCPPAEAYLSTFKASPRLWKDTFPVAFHVDYWDGLGWKNRFARPEYTACQRAYADRLRQDSVYTPEFVVNGREWRGFFDHTKLPPAGGGSGYLTLTARADGKEISVRFLPGAANGSRPLTLQVALLGVDLISSVQRGENVGRQLQHDFVVLGFAAQPWADAGSARVDLHPATPDTPGAIVAWVSAGDGTILQAAGGWLKPVVSAQVPSPFHGLPAPIDGSFIAIPWPLSITQFYLNLP
jgi:hypothetical protein